MTRPVPDPILVVDDDDTILITVAEFLEMEGYTVATARNGSEALAAVDRQPPGLVLLDMRMPVLDGWGFARVIHERGMGLKILVMSAAADAARWASEIEAVGAIGKPFEFDELMNRIKLHYGPPEPR